MQFMIEMNIARYTEDQRAMIAVGWLGLLEVEPELVIFDKGMLELWEQYGVPAKSRQALEEILQQAP